MSQSGAYFTASGLAQSAVLAHRGEVETGIIILAGCAADKIVSHGEPSGRTGAEMRWIRCLES